MKKDTQNISFTSLIKNNFRKFLKLSIIIFFFSVLIIFYSFQNISKNECKIYLNYNSIFILDRDNATIYSSVINQLRSNISSKFNIKSINLDSEFSIEFFDTKIENEKNCSVMADSINIYAKSLISNNINLLSNLEKNLSLYDEKKERVLELQILQLNLGSIFGSVSYKLERPNLLENIFLAIIFSIFLSILLSVSYIHLRMISKSKK